MINGKVAETRNTDAIRDFPIAAWSTYYAFSVFPLCNLRWVTKPKAIARAIAAMMNSEETNDRLPGKTPAKSMLSMSPLGLILVVVVDSHLRVVVVVVTTGDLGCAVYVTRSVESSQALSTLAIRRSDNPYLADGLVP